MEVNASEINNDDFISEPNFLVIAVYCVLFVVAAIGNLTVFISLYRCRHRKSRISLMIKHLSIADLIVTFIMIPIEVSWRITDRWIAGNVACKVFLFLRAFGPYLSSNVLICISLDRYFAVLYPLKVNDARRRGKLMLKFAWGASFVYCIPQGFVFSVMTHPLHPNYTQCVSFDFFTSPSQEIAYNFLCVTFMYFIPLLVIVIAYTAIMCEISKTSKSSPGDSSESSVISGRVTLRRSDMSNIARARSRTLRMTIIIVAVYIWCCTPYVIITLWYMLDRKSAVRLPKWLQDSFFMMVVSNSCMNPIVYGSFAINFKENCHRFSCLWSDRRSENLISWTRRPRKKNSFVGSGISRTSGIAINLRRGKTIHQNGRLTCSFEKEEKVSSADRPPSAARVSFSDSSSSRSHKFSFHSEPMKTNYSLAMDTFVSEPNHLSCHSNSIGSIDFIEKKVHFHLCKGRSIPIRARHV